MTTAPLSIATLSDKIKILMGVFATSFNFLAMCIIFLNIYSGNFSNRAESIWISLVLILLILLINTITIMMFLGSKSYKELIFPQKIKLPYDIVYIIGCVFGLFISGISMLFMVSDFINTSVAKN